jgi:hypothetical protein
VCSRYIQFSSSARSSALTYRCPKGSSVILCDSGTSAGSPVGASGYGVEGRDSRYALLCSWACCVVSTVQLAFNATSSRVHQDCLSKQEFNGKLTNGSPQYVQPQIWGLSTLMKIRGCPRGPPPPSQDTTRSFTQRTGCLWMRSMAASGRGYMHSKSVFVFMEPLSSLGCL